MDPVCATPRVMLAFTHQCLARTGHCRWTHNQCVWYRIVDDGGESIKLAGPAANLVLSETAPPSDNTETGVRIANMDINLNIQSGSSAGGGYKPFTINVKVRQAQATTPLAMQRSNE